MTVNNNAWNQDDSGGICTFVCGASPRDVVSFFSLWNWTSSPPAVHAYPNAELRSDLLPLRLGDLLSLQVSASWAFGPATLSEDARNPNSPEDSTYIQSNNVQANVVLDIFADEDAERSRTPSEQKYEFMVWVGQFGAAAQPVGILTPREPPVVVRVDKTDFTLWNGTKSTGQYVYSWLANETLTNFDMDFAPLLGFLVKEEGVSESLYMGTIQFGHETFLAASQMNFSISSYAANVQSIVAEPNSTLAPTASLPVATSVSGASKGVRPRVGWCGTLWLSIVLFLTGT
ncbi:glycoside hydrolase family 12 protein [Dothistroma septosporum NZE10]|uniref:Glycoside hydrolase family 12 protein n=1 Tax=Dothistroma septosporum (strain NZE10 / CBS 128990) TaxID=675120 RepID=N1PXX8_DOTSN|nr:glycoside hydrolase family 12 protein [Dothistroma septosporum NZE10]